MSSRIEELPDDYDGPPTIPLKPSTPPKPSTKSSSTGTSKPTTKPSQNGPPSSADTPIPIPDLPPTLRDTHHQTVDEVVADLKKTPFFMTSLDDIDPNDDNPELEAFKALLYEGTRGEIATNFKDQGNEQVRAKIWGDAKELYTKGLAALKRARTAEDPTGPEEDEKEDRLREALLANRALCHLSLQNYRSCVNDCVAALTLAPRNVKACFRMASALFALGKYAEAMAATNAGLTVDAENSALLGLREKVVVKQVAQEKAERAKREREERVLKVKKTLATALAARKILVRNTGQKPDMPDDAVLKMVPDELDMKSTLVFPVLVLYPMAGQSDVIKAFGEEQTLGGHLDYLLPLPWDERGEYKEKDLEAYIETREGGLVKWGKNVELLRVLSGGKIEVVDGIVRVSVVPKARRDEWIAELKRRKGKN